MIVTEAALRIHDSELQITCFYLRIVDDATRVMMAEGLARRWAGELAARQSRLGPPKDAPASGESPGGDM